jgi:nicotinate-nucleotide adenylyltransferase
MWVRPPAPVCDGLRIGLLGGSFDPAHEGHLYVSDVARKGLKLDQVWWLVTPGNPLKPTPGSVELRVARARLVARAPYIAVTGIEAALHTRYTIDTVTELQRRFPGARFIWLMGTDNLEQFSRWRRWRELAARIPIAVVRRPGSVLAPLRAPLARLLGISRQIGPAPSLVVLDGRRNLQSSTALRGLGDVDAAMLNTTL